MENKEPFHILITVTILLFWAAGFFVARFGKPFGWKREDIALAYWIIAVSGGIMLGVMLAWAAFS